MTLARYKLVILDFDGTLADSMAWMIGVLNEVAAAHRFRRVAPDEIETLRGLDSREILERLEVKAWRLPLIAADMRRRSAAAAIPLFPDTPRLLAGLRGAGMTLAAVSSNSGDTVRRVLGPSAAHITHYACGASLFGKAVKFKIVLRAGGIAPRDAIAIGDESRDIAAAKAAGVAAAAVTWGYARRPALEAAKPDFIFDTADALMAALY